jgi:Transposase DDE domain group 1
MDHPSANPPIRNIRRPSLPPLRSKHQGRLRSLLLLPRTQGNGRCVRGLQQREQGGEQRERIRLGETISRKHAGEFVELGFSWLFSSKFQKALQVIDDWVESTALVVRFYNKRGTAEQWIKEGKQAVKMTRLSCHRFRANELRLWLSLIAYNLGNLCRRLVLPARIDGWSLTSLQQRLVKTGGRLIKHARYYWLLLAESHLTRRLFGSMLRRIAALPSPAG